MVCCTTIFDDKMSPLFQSLAGDSEVTKAEQEIQKKHMFRSTLDRYKVSQQEKLDPLLANSTAHPGDVKMDTINTWLNKLYRSPGQKEFHHMFLSTCLRIIYADDYEKERHRVMAKYKFESKKQQALICAPRRFGKTFAVSFFAIVVAIVLPEIEISIFSPGKRQSVALMNHIFSFMKNLGEEDRVIRKNEEKMVLRSLNGKASKINAYPSAVKTLKGVSGTIVILEELAAIDPDVLFEVVCPLHQLDITALIGISTITTEDNFFTKYLKMKDKNGDSLFSVKYIYLACKPCRDKGIAHKCNHNNFLLPGWSSARKARTVKALMIGREDMLAREVGGVANALYGKAFLKKKITAFINRPRYHINTRQNYPVIFIAIDPNAGGKNSHFAMCSMLVHMGVYCIIGMESFPSTTARANHALVLQHIDRLDATGLFTNTLKVFILESNLGFESEHIGELLGQNVSNFIIMNEKDDGRVGFTTTNQMKQLAVEKARTKLGEGSLAISEEQTFVSVSQSYNGVIEILENQMTEFSEVIKEPEFSNPKKIYSGKHIGCDDLVMSFLFCCMWVPFFYNSPKYSQYI